MHHHNQGNKYEVIGYTVGKPVNVEDHFISSQGQIMNHQDFKDDNEFGYNNNWIPIDDQNQLMHGYDQLIHHTESASEHEFIKPGDSAYGGYD
jgi:hypothetical protein